VHPGYRRNDDERADAGERQHKLAAYPEPPHHGGARLVPGAS
jgi:hypothetical protein